MFDEDPTESDEAAASIWAAENVDGDRFKCQCGKWKPLAGSSPSGPSPYAIPICRECADGKFEILAVFSRGEVETSPAGELLALVGFDDDGTKYWEPWDPTKAADQADEIIEGIRQCGFGFDLQIGCQQGDEWLATFSGEDEYQGEGAKSRLAICRAAVKVLNAIDWQGKSKGATDGS